MRTYRGTAAADRSTIAPIFIQQLECPAIGSALDRRPQSRPDFGAVADMRAERHQLSDRLIVTGNNDGGPGLRLRNSDGKLCLEVLYAHPFHDHNIIIL